VHQPDCAKDRVSTVPNTHAVFIQQYSSCGTEIGLPFSSRFTSSNPNSSIGFVDRPYGRRASVRGSVKVTKRESSELRNAFHWVYFTEAKLLARSRTFGSSVKLERPRSFGEAAATKGQKEAAATPEIFPRRLMSSGWFSNS